MKVLRRWQAVLWTGLLCWQASAWAADVDSADVAAVSDTVVIEPESAAGSLDALLRQLTDASLNEAAVLLPQIAAQGGLDMLPLFEAMLAGELVFERDSRRLLRNNADGSIVDARSGEPVAEPGATGRIRLNNRLRSLLRSSIARMSLTQGSPAQRAAAATSMLATIDAGSAALLQQALDSESDPAVRELLDVGIALHTLSASDDVAQQLAAVDLLAGRLEAPVRNLLLRQSAAEAVAPAVRTAAAGALRRIEERVAFYQLLEKLFFGLSLGSVLLLAAIGLAVTFGVMGVINMAHGEMLMLGAYTTYVVQLLMPGMINQSLWVAIPAAFLVAALVGVLIQRCVIRHLNGRPLETLLATFGISLILQQTVRTIFSPLNRRVLAPDWMSGSLEINPVLALTWNRLYILAFALLVFVALVLILRKTSLGLNVRAVAQNRAMAQAMGVRTDRVDAMTFGLGSGIAGMAGVALSQLTNVGPNLGQSYIIDSFMVVVFGGVGNLLGTLLAAFSLGTANKFLEPATGAVLANILILVFIILFIQKRPKGLFPQKGRAAE